MEKFEYTGKKSGIDYQSISKVVNLMYFDGPLLAYYVGKKGEDYLLYWIDNDELFNRWLIFFTETEAVYKYISGRTTLYNLIQRYCADQIAVVDIDNEIAFHERGVIQKKSLENKYLLQKGSYFDLLDIDCSPYSEDKAICKLSTVKTRKKVKMPV